LVLATFGLAIVLVVAAIASAASAVASPLRAHASAVDSVQQPDGVSAPSRGNAQRLPNGNTQASYVQLVALDDENHTIGRSQAVKVSD
jgi:hypothetical protein